MDKLNVMDFDNYKPIKVPEKITDILEIVEYLSNGETLRVVGGNSQGNRDVLVKFSDIRQGFTVISLDTRPDKEGFLKKYWNVANVSLNYLMTYDVYLEKDFFVPNTKIREGDIVGYTRKDTNENDVAKVISVLVNENDSTDFAFKLSGDTFIYKDSEINKKDAK